jgi:hypothetical protein
MRRAVLAMVATSAGIVLHGQPTAAENAPIDSVDRGAVDLGIDLGIGPPVVGDILDLPPVTLPTISIPVLPIPVITVPAQTVPGPPIPDSAPAPEPPIADPDGGQPAPPPPPPPITDPPSSVPGADAPPAPDPSGSDTAEPITDPVVDVPRETPAISGVADDVNSTATGEADRVGTPTGDKGGSARGVHQPPPNGAITVAGPAVRSPLSDDPITAELTDVDNVAPPARDDGRADAELDDPPVETADSWTPTNGGQRGLPVVALGTIFALVGATAVVMAAIRRAISSRGQRADEQIDQRREPGRVSADTRPTSREPTSRVSADTRPIRREPTSRVSADTRPIRREPRPGVGGRPVDSVGRDRRAPRTPPARSARTNTRQPARSQRQPQPARRMLRPSDVGARVITQQPARRGLG